MDKEGRKTMNCSSSMVDIDQLCQLIDQTKFPKKIPSSQSKMIHLKRLNTSSPPPTATKFNENYSSLLIRFRSLSTSPSTLPSTDESNSRRTSVNSCNVEELTSYFEHYLHLPKALSSAAELMYT